MANFEIVIDSTVVLPSKVARPNVVLPFSFTIGGKTVEAKDLSASALKDALLEGTSVRSQIIPKDSTLALEKLLNEGKDVLLLCLSSGVSESFATANYIVQGLRIKYPDRRIFCIDTLSCCGGEGLLFALALKLKEEGLDAIDVAEKLEEFKLKLHHVLYTDDTSLLANSGKIASSATSVLNVKSIFDLTRSGQVGVLAKTMGRKKAITDIIKYVSSTIDKTKQHVFITYTDEQEAKLVAEKLFTLIPSATIECAPENQFVSTYLGDSSVCVCFFGEPRKA